ncbi:MULTISPECIES: DUF2383 domain-containing protein [Cellvibrio]|uniref:DUF2383 domain-containing protein n=1 Tax=Cellvibrio fibrivorans TaxID=126350 RepID=A0ABU1UV24_9GAMM|nr:DUF2383 domain-containing protein [Cellvibrio fibrivorans]MDR7089000.1 hypothetical protein [Cellvibrio fibrivorans]
MFRLLSDTEVALNELFVACRESIDHYHDAAELVGQSEIAKHFLDIANSRKLFLNRLASAIRELGDLPSVPDPDKEAGEMMLHHLSAALSSDYTNEALAQRIKTEEHILALVNAARKTEPNQSCTGLLNDLTSHIEDAINTLTKAV